MCDKVAYPITNKYTFGAVFSKVENVRLLLEEALRMPIREIRLVEPRHVLESSLRGYGVLMDVFVDDEAGSHRLATFLSYVDGGDTMGEKWVEHLDDEAQSLNNDEGWRNTMLGIALDHMEDIYDARQEGLAEGREEGRKEASAQLAALAAALVQADREEELAEAVLDLQCMEQLLAEFDLA